MGVDCSKCGCRKDEKQYEISFTGVLSSFSINLSSAVYLARSYSNEKLQR